MKRISIEPSFAAWRHAARELLRQGVEPASVEWLEGTENSAFSDSRQPAAAAPNPPAIPRDLLNRLKDAACFPAPDRWHLLYRVLWRWAHGERHVISPEDPDGALLAQRVQAVEPETDKLRSLTRFRRRDPSMGPPEFVGWQEPQHDLLERAADIFAGPMGESTWMLATPRGAVFWNGMLLRIGQSLVEIEEPAATAQAPSASAMCGEAVTSEPTEALWLAYYASASVSGTVPATVSLLYWRMPPAGPPLPAPLARARSRLGAQSAVVTVPPPPPVEYSAITPPFRDPDGPLATCRRCALWRNAQQAVAGVGPSHATIMAVGEQPGEHENRHGKPFTGAAGQLLDVVLERAGLDRDRLYLTYAVKHYKWEAPDQQLRRQAGQQRVHRAPEPREVEACQFWLAQELSQVAPRVVVALGATALKTLTGLHVNLSEYLGQTIAHDGRLIVPTWHPSYALRTADAGLREDIVEAIVMAFRRAAVLAAEGG
ncbi:DNA polymerase [Paraburkholderia fungorum]|uniref:Type-4 uracil-DNA glycosylase n=1 Tax=Paraburkholderia fungorum TaxID=134537 RepID=A0A1H1HE99_9BURK|nr:UdgX family uracil-DNA binding protein [Paraburkholderia fungorum]SDR23764.1 DNA polymerase [Paraburkholderia fungorum]